ncbi:MAG: O-antigen ligase family protein [Deltaproteobacteria bacterium]|nr:O-antigen ligase family protein [Deltaproteobacteria bacterium]MBI3017309.1 O-antigen ligase family protein [Deltaproteobacteria bacterium]
MNTDISDTGINKLITFIDQTLFSLLILFVFSLSFSLAIINICLYVSAILFLIKIGLTKKLTAHHMKNGFILTLFLLAALLSLINTPSEFLYLGFKGIKRLLFQCLFYLSIIDTVTSEKRLNTIVTFLCVGYGITTLDALWQYMSGYDFIKSHPLYNEGLYNNLNILRATATYDHPNSLGVYSSTFLFLFVIPAFYVFDQWKGFVWKFFSVIGLAASMLTFSRGALLSLFLTFSALFFIKKNKTALILPIIGLLIGAVIIPKDVYTWIKKTSLSPATFMLSANSDKPYTGRAPLWKTATSMFKKHPYIGVGYYSFSDQYAFYKNPQDPNHNIQAHSSYFSMCAELGLAGMLTMLGFLIFIYRRGYQAYTAISAPLLKNYHLAILFCFSALLINASYESVLRQTRMSGFFWFLSGLICAIYHIQTERLKAIGLSNPIRHR